MSKQLKMNGLQWGHDKIVMEVRATSAAPKEEVMLQWGHDKIVMEVSYSS